MSDDNLTVWAVRVSRRAFADMQTAWQYFSDVAGEEIADAWQGGLEGVLASLAALPERFAVAESESALFNFPVRRALYRHTKSGPAYLVFFRLTENSLDAPTVFVFHIRHGAQAPLEPDDAAALSELIDQ